jgi:hypothetical protein
MPHLPEDPKGFFAPLARTRPPELCGVFSSEKTILDELSVQRAHESLVSQGLGAVHSECSSAKISPARRSGHSPWRTA